MSGIVCSGNIRVAYVDADGVPTGAYIGLINTTKLSLTLPDPDKKVRTSKQNSTFGQALDSIAFPKPPELELDTDDVGDAEILGWAMGGSPAGFTQSSATVTGAAFIATKDSWVPIAARRVSALVVKDVTDATTYVLGTDYLADTEAGFIKILAGSAIVDAATLHLSYTVPALTGQTISGGNRPSLQVRIDGDLINLATGKHVHLLVRKAILSPSGGLDLMGSDFLVAAMKGNMIVVPGFAPFELTQLD